LNNYFTGQAIEYTITQATEGVSAKIVGGDEIAPVA
jgi:hypothetical protein